MLVEVALMPFFMNPAAAELKSQHELPGVCNRNFNQGATGHRFVNVV
jgi:hypothetical protein